MTLQSSDSMTIEDIATEFGCANDLESCAAAAGISNSNIKLPDSFYGLSAYTPINVSVSDKDKEAFGTGDLFVTLYAMVSDGDGTHSYSWSKVSWCSSVFINGSTTNSTCSIRCTTPGDSGSANATFKCTVNDGTTTDNDNALAEFYWES